MNTSAISHSSLVSPDNAVKIGHDFPKIDQDELAHAMKWEQALTKCAKYAACTIVGAPIAFVLWLISLNFSSKVNKILGKDLKEVISDLNTQIANGLKITFTDKKWGGTASPIECDTGEIAVRLVKMTDVDTLDYLHALKMTAKLPVVDNRGKKLTYENVELIVDKDQIQMRIDGAFRVSTPSRKTIEKECTQINGKKVIQRVDIKFMEEGITQASALWDVRQRKIVEMS